MLSLHCPSASLNQLTCIYQKVANTLLWHSDICGCHQGIPLVYLDLVPRVVYTHGYHRNVKNGERVIYQLPLSEHSKRLKNQESSLSVQKPY